MRRMTGYRLIVVPYELGRLQRRRRQRARAPAGRRRGARALGVGCAREARARPDRRACSTGPGAGEVDACFELIRQVAEQVREARRRRRVPRDPVGQLLRRRWHRYGLGRAGSGRRLVRRPLRLQHPRHVRSGLLRRHGAGRAHGRRVAGDARHRARRPAGARERGRAGRCAEPRPARGCAARASAVTHLRTEERTGSWARSRPSRRRRGCLPARRPGRARHRGGPR